MVLAVPVTARASEANGQPGPAAIAAPSNFVRQSDGTTLFLLRDGKDPHRVVGVRGLAVHGEQPASPYAQGVVMPSANEPYELVLPSTEGGGAYFIARNKGERTHPQPEVGPSGPHPLGGRVVGFLPPGTWELSAHDASGARTLRVRTRDGRQHVAATLPRTAAEQPRQVSLHAAPRLASPAPRRWAGLRARLTQLGHNLERNTGPAAMAFPRRGR